MVHGGISVYTGQLSRLGIPRQTLKEGSQVLVRIISDKGGGKYEGSVAGARVTITSAFLLCAFIIDHQPHLHFFGVRQVFYVVVLAFFTLLQDLFVSFLEDQKLTIL